MAAVTGGHLLPSGIFAECRGTRQSPVLPRARLYRVPGTRQSPALPRARLLSSALFCRVRHSAKYCFAECPDKKHSAKSQALGKVQFSSGASCCSRRAKWIEKIAIFSNLYFQIKLSKIAQLKGFSPEPTLPKGVEWLRQL